MSRDPTAEQGGLNLYGFVDNNGVNKEDFDGRGFVDCCNAMAELVKANVQLQKRLAEAAADVLETGLDKGHRDAIQQALNRVQNAAALVAKHCGTVVGAAAALATAAVLIEEALAVLAGAAAVAA